MFLEILICLPLACLSAIWCGNQNCTSCTSGYLFESSMCIIECPTGYKVSADLTKCISVSSLVLVDIEVDDSHSFNISSIGGFTSINSQSFLSNSMTSPVITKDRGLLFTNKSILVANQGWVLSPNHRITYYINSFAPGIIFRVVLGNQTLLSVTWNNTHLTHNYLLTNTTDSFVRGHSLSYEEGWKSAIVNAYYSSGFYTIKFSWFNFITYPGFEFRHQYSNCTFELGSRTNSFVGFLYKLQIINSNTGDIFFTSLDNNCRYNQYLFNSRCYDCNSSCPSFPLCTRESCNLCYSSNCSSCTGYRFSDCSECSSGTLPECNSGFNCLNGTLFNCSECKTGKDLFEGLCINPVYNPENIDIKYSLFPVINVKFNVFSQFYDVFQSGNDSSTWHPNGNADSDDPVHYTMRGLYIFPGKLSFLKTRESFALSYNFTIALWLYNLKGGIFSYKGTLYLYDYYRMRIRLRNIDEFVYFRSYSGNGYIYNWYLFGVSVCFNDGATTFVTSFNTVLYRSVTKSGFYFYDDLNPFYVGNYPQAIFGGFYYSVTVWQTFLTDFSQVRDICGQGIYAKCLWNCSESAYYNTIEKRCRSCSTECLDGCSSFGSCSKCFNVSCNNCSTYTDNYTCDALNVNPCVSGSVYINKTKCCPAQCLDCFENSVFKCLWCTSEYNLLGTICYNICPIGFKSLNSVCVLIDSNMIYEVNFNNLDSVVWSTNQRVNFSVPYPSKFYKTSQINNPRPALNRGFYFSIYSYMNSNFFAIPYNFTTTLWIKVENDGILFTRNGLNVFTDQYVTLNGTEYNLKFESSRNWKIFHFITRTELNGNHLICIKIIQISINYRCFSTSEKYIFDGNQILQLGNNQTSFEGFIWMMRFYYKEIVEQLSSILKCNSTQSSNCLTDCSIDSFFNGSSCEMCQNCPLGCVRANDCNLCSDPICENCSNFTSVCSNCFSNSSLQVNKCVCNPGFYWNQSRLICANCIDPCIECSGELLCFKCQENSINIEGVCICITGYFLNISGNCEPCHPECLNCSGRSNSECVSCAINSLLDSSFSCKCEEGYFRNGSSCKSCDFLCKTCFSSTPLSCISCKNNMMLTSNQSCVCPSSQYLEVDTCKDCDVTCLECVGSDDKNCTKCKGNAILINNSCTCQEKWFMVDGVCEFCHKTCLECSGLERNECLVCDAEFRLQSSGQCWCEMGLYWDEAEEVCLNCSRFCLDCNYFYTSDCQNCSEECFFCQKFSIFNNGSCNCLTGYYSSNDICFRCNENCLECFDEYFYTCTSCSNAFLNGVCYQDCPIGSSLVKGECLFTDQVVLLRFQDFALDVADSLKRTVTEKCSNNFYNKTLIPAVPFIFRGVYFNGKNSCLQISSTSPQIPIFSNTFEFSLWILFESPGSILQLLSKDSIDRFLDLKLSEQSLNLSLQFDSMKYLYSVNKSTLYSTWFFLRVKTEFYNISTITVELDSEIIRFINFSPKPFFPGESLITLGSDLMSSFSGFIYQVTLNNFKWRVKYSACDGCSSCPTEEVCLPPCKTTEYFNFTTKECLPCIEKCSDGCRNDLKCGMCYDFACISCAGFNDSSCLSCEDGFVVKNNTCQECPSGQFFNSSTKKCDNCYFLCANCSKLDVCTSCIENAHLSDGNCICNKGFKAQEYQCLISYFYVLITLSFTNEITLVFNEALEKPLSKSNLQVFIDQDTVSFKITKVKNSVFTLKLDDSSLNQKIYANIQFFPIYSETSSILFNHSANVLLFFEDKSEIQQKIEDSRMYGQTGSSAGLGFCLFSSIMSLDITSLFNFMNFAEIFSVISLYGTRVPEDTLEFLRSLRVQKMVPNVIGTAVGEKSKVDLNILFKSFGFSSNKMLVNSGTNLVIFAIILIVFILQILVLKLFLKKFPKLNAVQEYFHYKIFIEYWLQTSLEILVTSSYSISISPWSNPWDVVDYFLSWIVIVSCKQIMQLLTFILCCFVFFKRSRATSENKKKIDGKFGYLFANFKQESNYSLTFHLVFFLRRIFITVLLFAPVPSEFRLILSGLISISVNFKKMFFYLCTSSPFTSKLMNFLHISNELITFSVHLMMFFYLLDLQFVRNSLNDYCMNFVTASWALNCICSLSNLLLNLYKRIIAKCRKNVKVEAEISTDYHMKNKPLKISDMLN